MAAHTEGNYIGDVLKREFEPLYNRETGTLISGQNLAVGAVLGKITDSGNITDRGKYTAVAPAASDGSEAACAVLLASTDASSADTKTIILARGPAVVAADFLVWPSGATSGQKTAATAQLTALGIVSRAAY